MIERKWTKERHEAARAHIVDGVDMHLRTVVFKEDDARDMLAEIDRCWTIIEARAGIVTEKRKAGARHSFDIVSPRMYGSPLSGDALAALWAEIERGWAEIEGLAVERDAAKAEIERAKARLAHAHDSSNALYQAADLLCKALESFGDSGLHVPSHIATSYAKKLRAALDPDLAAGALREVQRRDLLGDQVAKLTAEVSGLIREREDLLNKLAARPVLTEEAALRWAQSITLDPIYIAEALWQAAHLQWPTAEQAPTFKQSTAEIKEGLYIGWERQVALTAHGGMPAEPTDQERAQAELARGGKGPAPFDLGTFRENLATLSAETMVKP